jgi:hypothetical protein
MSRCRIWWSTILRSRRRTERAIRVNVRLRKTDADQREAGRTKEARTIWFVLSVFCFLGRLHFTVDLKCMEYVYTRHDVDRDSD